MFIDKQKLEREYLDEITKIGNLFDTIKVDYCVLGGYALLAHGIKSRQPLDSVIVAHSDNKAKILEMIFKLNYTICSVKDNVIGIKKSTRYGDILLDISLAVPNEKDFVVNYQNKQLKFTSKLFDQDRKEIAGSFMGGKSGKGYFKAAALEEIYFSKLNSGSEAEMTALEMIKASGKLDVERLLKLLEKNGLI
jgi:hypothetical protein